MKKTSTLFLFFLLTGSLLFPRQVSAQAPDRISYQAVIRDASGNNELTHNTTYGALCNWHAVNTEKLCPTGWHVPSDDEWTVLTDYLEEITAGGKLKETGTSHWKSPNTGATNETGFSALPAGIRNFQGYFLPTNR